ncbi:hypothetical protein Q1695_014860 [Nippostrongylus brasiliensis]|nr:hypothetical protein Q1695_014860 [Nippostrongylus brasiliensis]
MSNRRRYHVVRFSDENGETKEEILTIASPSSHQEDQNDSGIENRTADSHSPSTSLDFSPRSDSKLTSDPISPKRTTFITEPPTSREQPPDYAPPPPPPLASSEHLDQVLIPLNVSSRSTAAITSRAEDVDYPPPPLHLRRNHSPDRRGVQELSSRFESVSAAVKAPTYRFEERTTAKPFEEHTTESQNVDLTVELNREQRGQVTAIRYPSTKKIETVPSSAEDSKGATFVSRVSHRIEPTPTSPPPAYGRATVVSSHSSTTSPPQPRHRVMPPTTVYRAVDIPFDESPAAYQPKKDDNMHTVVVAMGSQPVQKGLGFSITIERGRPTIDSVIVSSPADRAGLLIGDRVISINGEELKDKYPSAINRMLHEAARLGEAEVCIERKDATRKDQPLARDYSSLPRSTSSGALPYPRRDNSLSSNHRATATASPTRSYYDSSTNAHNDYRTYSNTMSSDYKVTSMHEKTGPGKLTDFVPESERNAAKTADEEKREFSYRRASDEEPRLIRNYDLPPTTTATTKITPIVQPSSTMTTTRRVTERADTDSTVTKRSTTLPRDVRRTLLVNWLFRSEMVRCWPAKRTTHVHVESHDQDDDTVAGRSYLRKTLRQTLTPSPPVGILRRYPEIDDSVSYLPESAERTTSSAARDYRGDYRTDGWSSGYPHQRSRSSYELRDRSGRDYSYGDEYRDRQSHVREHYEVDEMYRKRTQPHTVDDHRGDHIAPPRTTIVPIRRIDTAATDEFRRAYPTRPYHTSRSRSSDYILEREYSRRDDVAISDVSHRFYDRDGKFVDRDVRRGYDVDIERNYDFDRDAERRSLRGRATPRVSKSVERRVEEHLEYEEKEKRMWIPDRRVVESRDWRDVITQQRQPAPGRPADTQRIRDASASLGSLPAIINRKLEETRKLEKERHSTEYEYRSYDSRREPLSQPPLTESSYEKTDYGRFEKSYTPDYRSRQYETSRYGTTTQSRPAAVDSGFTSDYRRREHRELSPSPGYGRREMSAAFREEVRREPLNNDQVVAVSGKHRCAHCADELGRGAAMIIESLNLFYHLACFKCYVCKTPLGSGATGADVRVREGRLHCQSCYSNDRVQLSKPSVTLNMKGPATRIPSLDQLIHQPVEQLRYEMVPFGVHGICSLPTSAMTQ